MDYSYYQSGDILVVGHIRSVVIYMVGHGHGHGHGHGDIDKR